ncbi:MAG: UDP-N-acetylglucosamine 1-carboxyvinyltransferase [Defluviitaleaceae bacterium]|nr:UDP-N-acetylglucosamine 1-carboxyvinyltransferase [Defluviitaleaceae bacterium]
MGSFFILGGNKINGEISIGGAKNAALPILAACILIDGEKTIKNVPNISDVRVAVDILRDLGLKVLHEKNTVTISGKISKNTISKKYSEKMRSSITFLGAILGKLGEGECYFPGGCPLGERPIELHKKGFLELGFEVIEETEKLICKNKNDNKSRIGANIFLDFPSVGATQNIILASVYAKGSTIITNAAKEPEIVDMVNFLNACGARIKGAGTDEVIIEGVAENSLKGCEYIVMPDRIIAGTYMAAAAITNGSLILKDVYPYDVYPIKEKFINMGIAVTINKNSIAINAEKPIRKVKIRTGTHPGFPTDMQAQTMALLTQAEGTSEIEENIFEARDKHVKELIKMGANITSMLNGRHFIIKGKANLKGTKVLAEDLRGGASLVIAALAAEGKTEIKGIEHIERGYENIVGDLNKVGANIRFIN